MNTNKSHIPTITFDVMLHERFVCTLSMPLGLKHLVGYNGDEPQFVIPDDDFFRFIEEKRPSLKGKDYHICPCSNKPHFKY